MDRIAKAVDRAEARTGLQLCVYLGDAAAPGDDRDAHTRALDLLAGVGGAAPDLVVLVAPAEHRVEVVTSAALAAGRVPDAACAAIVDQMLPALRAGRYDRAIAAAVDALAEVAGPGTSAPGTVELPDVLDDRD